MSIQNEQTYETILSAIETCVRVLRDCDSNRQHWVDEIETLCGVLTRVHIVAGDYKPAKADERELNDIRASEIYARALGRQLPGIYAAAGKAAN